MMRGHDPCTRPATWVLALLLACLPISQSSAATGDDDAPPAAETPAADPDAAPAPPPSPAGARSPAEGPKAAAGDAAGKTGGDPGGFVPTEEISEDFAVSFPVDI